MAVFTPVSENDARDLLRRYDLGGLIALTPIAEGVENTNYRLEVETGLFVLTLFEGRTDEVSLPFCLGLTAHLADRGVPAPRPIADRSGGWLGRLNGRAAAVIEWRPGDWLRQPTDADQHTAGAMLAQLHLAAAHYPGRRDNPVGPDAWRALIARTETAASDADAKLLAMVRSALKSLGDPYADDLPQGAIHADYFPDNVLFQGGVVSGVIDPYFACTGPLAYDLAVALSAWGFEADGRARPSALDAFVGGYESVRPLTPTERSALPQLGAAAAIRFTLTRLHDRVFHDPSKLVTPKDPAPFLARLDHWTAPV